MFEEAKVVLAKALSKTNSRTDFFSLLECPYDRSFGDFALPCFKLSHEKNPNQTALELKDKLVLPKIFRSCEVKGPYLNFFFNELEVVKKIVPAIISQKSAYGKAKRKRERIIVEYCQANPMKAFHIGHTRNICLGEAIAKIFEYFGENVFRVNYCGDVGPHVSKSIYAYRYLSQEPEPFSLAEKEKWLNKLYALGEKAVSEDKALQEKMREMVVLLEKGDKDLKKDWLYLRSISFDCFNRIFEQLGTRFDKIICESEVEKEGIKIALDLEKQGFAKRDQGAIIVDLESYGLGKFLILKSDGAALYSTKDIALAKLKKTELNAIKSYNIVGSEQSFYFKQLIKTIELLNQIKKDYCETIHLPYELVNVEGAKMSSRLGNVITYTDLFETIFNKTLEETKARHSDWPNEKVFNVAEKIALAALKYGMLSQDRNKTLVFNWEKAIKMEGETGPFILYSYARASSILRKKSFDSLPKKFVLETKAEKDLVVLLAKLDFVVKQAYDYKAPNKLAQYLIDLSKSFNAFYRDSPVLSCEGDQLKTRLSLVYATTLMLELGCSLLNISLVEEM
ncbi:MAG: arginine--tRNA ligase [Candidatus Diapherotrites archaeon]